jgi:acyl-coenzyme A synthetase/AMP-(fatty) acid ligase
MAQALISFSNYKKEKLNLIRTKFFSTGAFLYKSTASRFKKEFDVDLIDCYGITEVGGSFALSSKFSLENKLSKFSKGIKIKLLRNNEICIKSKFMFEGYLKKYSKVKKYKHSYFKSGDLGKIYKGKYSITGRLKEIIKKGGEPVSLLHIEDITLKHEGVKDVLAKGVTSEFWGEDIELDVIFSASPYKLNKDNKINLLKSYLGQNLPRIQMPRKINSVTHIPKTSIGKNYRRYFN